LRASKAGPVNNSNVRPRLLEALMNVLVRALVLLLLSGAAFADEGMWTFDNFPKQAVKEKLGVVARRT